MKSLLSLLSFVSYSTAGVILTSGMLTQDVPIPTLAPEGPKYCSSPPMCPQAEPFLCRCRNAWIKKCRPELPVLVCGLQLDAVEARAEAAPTFPLGAPGTGPQYCDAVTGEPCSLSQTCYELPPSLCQNQFDCGVCVGQSAPEEGEENEDVEKRAPTSFVIYPPPATSTSTKKPISLPTIPTTKTRVTSRPTFIIDPPPPTLTRTPTMIVDPPPPLTLTLTKTKTPSLTTKTIKTRTTTRSGAVTSDPVTLYPPPSSTTKKPVLTTKTIIPVPTPTRKACGGLLGIQCAKGEICINDPDRTGCGMECDAPGVCVKEEYCGGFAGLRCETTGMRCIDDPRDNCDPKKGGADCMGICY